jgi:Protein of unknown function (DUF998)
MEVALDIIVNTSNASAWSVPAAWAAMIAATVAVVALIALHVTSPAFQPSWRMVSEYASGPTPGLLMVFFFAWAVSSLALLVALFPHVTGGLGKTGLILLALAAIGQVMGGVFDISHKLHGPAALIGIPTLCVAAILLTLAMARQPGISAPPLWIAVLPLVSLVLMVVSVMMFFSALKSAGIEMSPDAAPLKELPDGVTGWVGWANRALVLSACLWVSWAATSVIRA